MKKRIILILISVLLIIPIFYLAICINYNLDIYKSLHIIEDIYKQVFIYKKKLQKEVWVCLLYSFVPFVIIIIYTINTKIKPSYGYAHFARVKDLYKMKLNFKKGFVLGLYKTSFFKKKKLYFNDPLSVLVIASPGTGKTSSIVVPNLLSIPCSSIVIDIKGELSELTKNVREKVLKNKIFIFNPYGEDNNLYFNPFDKEIIKNKNFDEIFELVKEISNILFVVPKESKDPFWINQGKKLFRFFAMYDIQKNGSTNFFEIMQYPTKSEEALLTVEYQQLKQDIEEVEETKIDVMQFFFKQASEQNFIDPLIQNTAREFERMNSKSFKDIVSTFNEKLEVFNDYRMQKVVSKMSFKYEDLRKENITIYLKIKEKDIDTLSPFIRIFTENVGKNLMIKENKNPDERIYFWLDEFTRFGQLPFLLELPSISRSYNLPSIFLTQTESHIKKTYSVDDLDIIAGSCHYKVIFTLNDDKTAERMSKTVGNITRHKVSESSQENKIFGSKSKSLEGYALVTSQDLQNIPEDELIISVGGHKATPIKAKANYYFKSSEYTRLIKKYNK
jgi:type IV secretion system protein VirD4